MKKVFGGIVLIILLFLIPLAFHEGPDEIADTEDIVQNSDCETVDKETEDMLHTISNDINMTGRINPNPEKDKIELDKIKERLNDNVLESRESIREELQVVQNHRCVDIESPGEENLQMYEALLEYYYTMMPHERNTQVDKLYLENTEDMFLSIKLMAETENQKHFEMTFYPVAGENPLYENVRRTKKEKIQHEERSDFSLFMQEEVLDRVLLVLENPLTIARDQAGEYYEWEVDNQNEEDIDRKLRTSKVLDMGFSLVRADGAAYLYDKKMQKINVYPTEATYGMLERLEEVVEEHDTEADISYPEKLIESENWDEIARFFTELEFEMMDEDYELFNYIYKGDI